MRIDALRIAGRVVHRRGGILAPPVARPSTWRITTSETWATGDIAKVTNGTMEATAEVVTVGVGFIDVVPDNSNTFAAIVLPSTSDLYRNGVFVASLPVGAAYEKSPTRPTRWHVTWSAAFGAAPIGGYARVGSISSNAWVVVRASGADWVEVERVVGRDDPTAELLAATPADYGSMYRSTGWELDVAAQVNNTFVSAYAIDAPGIDASGAYHAFIPGMAGNRGTSGTAWYADSGTLVSGGPTGVEKLFNVSGQLLRVDAGDLIDCPEITVLHFASVPASYPAVIIDIFDTRLVRCQVSSASSFTAQTQQLDGATRSSTATFAAPGYHLRGAIVKLTGTGNAEIRAIMNGVFGPTVTCTGGIRYGANRAAAFASHGHSGTRVAGFAAWSRALSDAEVLEQARRCGVAA